MAHWAFLRGVQKVRWARWILYSLAGTLSFIRTRTRAMIMKGRLRVTRFDVSPRCVSNELAACALGHTLEP